MRHLLGIDVGGTFTDFVANDGNGGIAVGRSRRFPPTRSPVS
jgi:N-methylhydantoinase A/oxoprolinase/acetone carboxylase beta subunit